ncbi:MAG: cyclic nucleotide-binding domain-containing protein [Kangiellaceae bacterium]|jgi:CRP-like cAMP-binding protein|nr:cyclic nucleotide-binding domain-containing protein [Kangiellaceae bacterium]
MTEEYGVVDLNELYDLLPRNMVEQIFFSCYSSLIGQISILQFSDNSNVISRLICHKLEPQIYNPANVIIKKGADAEKVYFIFEGKVDRLDQEDRKVSTNLGPLDFFGEEALAAGTIHNATHISNGFVLLYTLSTNDFEEILSDNYLKEFINLDSLEQHFTLSGQYDRNSVRRLTMRLRNN